MTCTSCSTKNPDEARFCLKCGIAVSLTDEKAAPAAAATPVAPFQQPKPAGASRPATPVNPASEASGVDRFFSSLAVAVGSILLALVLAGIGYNSFQESTAACSAAVTSGAGMSSCNNSGFWPFFLAAFGVAGGGLKMASRIGKK